MQTFIILAYLIALPSLNMTHKVFSDHVFMEQYPAYYFPERKTEIISDVNQTNMNMGKFLIMGKTAHGFDNLNVANFETGYAVDDPQNCRTISYSFNRTGVIGVQYNPYYKHGTIQSMHKNKQGGCV